MKFHDVPTRLLPDIWPFAQPFLDKAMQHHPFLDCDGLLQILLAGKAQLVVLVDGRIVAAAVMQIIAYPGKNVALILAFGGETNSWYRRYWRATFEYLETWARDRGCAIIHLFGRPGWIRAAFQCGGKAKTVALAWKELVATDV